MSDEDLAEYWRKLSLGEYVELPDNFKGLVDEYTPRDVAEARAGRGRTLRFDPPVRKRIGWAD